MAAPGAEQAGGLPTQLINQIRGLLAEYGIVLPQHPGQVRSGLPTVLEDAENQLTGFGRKLFRSLYEELKQFNLTRRLPL